MEKEHKPKILIADDSEMNREILKEMLEKEYEIIEAEDGVQAVAKLQQYSTDLSLLLLDFVMPKMDGFGVLGWMNQSRLIDDIPVIMISAESNPIHIERAYDLGVTDFIGRPFDAMIVHRRVVNTILLYAKQKKLRQLVVEQIYDKEQQSNLMIDILSHIVEFRNGESGLHVVHVRVLTELLLNQLIRKTGQYQLSRSDVALISTASALHDIGKIAIPSEILNKPGRLTPEEFAIMKTHSMEGAKMLQDLPIHQNHPLVKVAYQICRWHHERYDGRGYPDGLKGDEIPISAQIVALADVYDALTSERVYKKALPHETAITMIVNGECGCFNPLVLECLTDVADTIQAELHGNVPGKQNQKDIESITEEIVRHEELSASERILRQLEHEKAKNRFFASLREEIQFEYTCVPSAVTVSPWSVQALGLDEVTLDPTHSEKMLEHMSSETLETLRKAFAAATPEAPRVRCECNLIWQEKELPFCIIGETLWSGEEPPCLKGIIGTATPLEKGETKQ